MWKLKPTIKCTTYLNMIENQPIHLQYYKWNSYIAKTVVYSWWAENGVGFLFANIFHSKFFPHMLIQPLMHWFLLQCQAAVAKLFGVKSEFNNLTSTGAYRITEVCLILVHVHALFYIPTPWFQHYKMTITKMFDLYPVSKISVYHICCIVQNDGLLQASFQSYNI